MEKRLTSQDVRHILCNQMVHRVHNSPPPANVLSQVSSMHTLPSRLP
jgi:hypothetical protein